MSVYYFNGPQGFAGLATSLASDFGTYGTYDEFVPADALRKCQSYGFFRRRLNVVAIISGYAIPWTLFCFVFALTSFNLRYYHPTITWMLTFAILIGIVAFGLLAVMTLIQRRRGQSFEEPHWRMFLALTCALAWGTAVYAGNQNYYMHMAPYLDLSGMRTKIDIDPATTRGIEMMDAGVLHFMGRTNIDLHRTHGFKNSQTYCVAPITRDNATLVNYDFWAVGIDCCNGAPGDFKDCVADGDLHGVQAVRYTFDATDRSFLRLAIQQAEAKFNIKATHPLFLLWAKDAAAFRDEYQNKAYRWYMLGMCVSFGVQVALVALGAYFIQTNC